MLRPPARCASTTSNQSPLLRTEQRPGGDEKLQRPSIPTRAHSRLFAPSVEKFQFFVTKPPTHHCENCSRELVLAEVGRPRRYCSAACRTKAWRTRAALCWADHIEQIQGPSVTKPIEQARQGATLQLSRTAHPTGVTGTGPKLRPRPRQGAL